MTKQGPKIELKELRRLYNSSADFKVALDYFASRERNWRETKINRFRKNLNDEGKGISRGEAIALFRRLEELGCGNFVVGRRGSESRFRWSVGFIDVGQAAAGETEEIDTTAPLDAVDPADDLLEHKFLLRKDLHVPIRLPADLTTAEASRLAAYVQTLPFQD
jgi:hypothetical protein